MKWIYRKIDLLFGKLIYGDGGSYYNTINGNPPLGNLLAVAIPAVMLFLFFGMILFVLTIISVAFFLHS